MNLYLKYTAILLLSCNVLLAQYNGSNFAISTNYSFTTDSQIFLAPDAEHILDRNQSFGIENISSYSVELRYLLSEFLILGISFEYIKASAKGRNLLSRFFEVEDGFEIYPLELSAYYFLPFSTEDFKFYMGGGIGIYTGKRTRKFGDINYTDVESDIGYGIQVSTGMDYMIFDNISVRGELRFRDPDFKVTNKYSDTKVIYNGLEYTVTDDKINSKVNVDGITFRIGAVVHFSLFN